LEGLRSWRERDDLYVFPGGLFSSRPTTLSLDTRPPDPRDSPVLMDQDYRETALLAAADLRWQPVARHSVLLGLESKQVEVDQADWTWTNLPMALPPTWLDTQTSRRVLSVIAQDAFRASERLTLTATLRHDDYDDVGAYTSPRAAAVWRIDDHNILKLQYAKAFRPPTFYELAYPGPEPIDVAEITTYELGCILKRPTWEAQAILFRSDLKDPILFDELGAAGFANCPDAKLEGIELEYQQRFGQRVKVDANLSYVDATNEATGDPLPGGASLLGNLALLWRANDRWTAALQLRYVGERSREPKDPRPPLDPYRLLDLTLNWRSPGPGLDLHLGVKNLADSDVRYADQFQSFAGLALPYPESYPRPGRQLWLSVGYAF